ncbi:MAG: mycothiol synthase, partial [Terrimesophilobacter sp.]
GTALAVTVLREHAGVKFAWAHGDHPASRALAARFGFTPVRTLLQLRAPVTDATMPTESRIRSFRPGKDDSAWLALNAMAFAQHPEQGKLTQRDLDDRMAESWFDADDFLLLADGERILGFCWLKVVGQLGEIYAIGIDPTRQGEGLGGTLMAAAFAHLARREIATVALYVEADNEPARALYRRYGFTQHTIDVRYERTIR